MSSKKKKIANKKFINILGAREHNLKNIDVSIPKDSITVITGLSGSGKSSLAFDTIYAEGQRRYVESLSAYARQFLEMMQKPDLDQIDGLSPAIAIEQKTTSKNPRSTVGTVTEVYDYLRLMFARIGVPHSPSTGLPIKSQTVTQMVDQVHKIKEGTKAYLLSPIIRGRKGEYRKEFSNLLKKGFQRVKIDGEFHELDNVPSLEKNIKHDIDVVVDIIKPFEIEFSYSRCNSLIGDELPKKKIKDVLQSLEIEIVNETEDKLNLKVPTYRVDVQRECDVIEDILRIYGYNSVPIPVSLKSSIIVSDDRVSPVKIVKEISNLLVSNGFHEIMNNSLTKKEYYNDLEQSLEENHIELLNPLSQDLNILRRSLLFGGLESIARNNNMKNSNLKFFEFGKTYSKNAQGDYNEAKHLSLFVTGMKSENSWVENSTKVSFYTIKGYVSSIVNRLGISKLKTKAVQNEFLSEGVGLYFKKTLIIEFGKIKNRFLKATGVKQDVYFADINWDEVLKLLQYQKTKLSPISKFHPVKRDLSLLLNDSINYSDLERIAFEVERKILKKVELFDIYQGPKLPKGKKSYALSFILQSDEFTLKDKQIENTMQKLQNAFQDKLGAELR